MQRGEERCRAGCTEQIQIGVLGMKISGDRRAEEDHALQVRSRCFSRSLFTNSTILRVPIAFRKPSESVIASLACYQLLLAPPPPELPPPNPPNPPPPPNRPLRTRRQSDHGPATPNIPENSIQNRMPRRGVKRTIRTTIISRRMPPAEIPCRGCPRFGWRRSELGGGDLYSRVLCNHAELRAMVTSNNAWL